jgi:hypothetical protein
MKSELSQTIIDRINSGELAIVPVIPSEEMTQSAWADALAEDANGVWNKMVEAGRLSLQNRELR